MVLHVGIFCNEAETKFITFDSITHEQVTQNTVAVEPNDFNHVNDTFKRIKSSVTNDNKLGCLCICLGNSYDNKIRKRFIQVGKEIGFKLVEITDSFSADFVALISASDSVFKSKLQNGDFAWVFSGQKCRIWRKDEDKIRFVTECKYLDTVESLYNIKSLIGINPDMIFYESSYEISHNILEEMFRQNVRVYSFVNSENGALIKARILAGDNEVMCYKIESLLERDISLKNGDKTILDVKAWTPLPYSTEIVAEKTVNENMLLINSEINSTEKALPNAKKFIIKFGIDSNGLYNIGYDTNLNNVSLNESPNFEEIYSNPFAPKISTGDSVTPQVLEKQSNIKLTENQPQSSHKDLYFDNFILDESDLDDGTITLDNCPILVALARLQPLPK